MKLKLYTADGSEHSEKEVARFPVFENDKGVQALRQVVLGQLANRRQGNASTKTRAEVSGTGKKPFRQKGTGMARQGTRRATQHRGGGIAFGPKPRDYSQKLNKKLRLLAFQRALFERGREGELKLIENFGLNEPKTRLMHSIVSNIAPVGKILLVDDSFNDNAALAARNLPRVELTRSGILNSHDLVYYDQIIVTEKAMDTVLARINGGEPS